DENKNVWGWGKNHFGMLGTNDTISRSTPVMIKSLKNIVDIGAGCFESIALDVDGKLFTFGDNPSGQLGIGNTKRCFTPQLMELNINDGFLESQTLETVAKPEIAKQIVEPIIKKEDVECGMDGDMLLKTLKYIFVAISIILNIVLYKKLKKRVA
ncbi:MAG TPA: hypothetical protein VFF27_15785, partial [Bacteroidia bacterium]|nr:hypothetical protein [Bacteroidia bacterium]